MTQLSYRVVPIDPEAHLFGVELELDAPSTDALEFTLPAWIPGSYMVRDFSRNLISIEATAGGATVILEKLDKQTWRVECDGSPILLSYRIYAWERSVRAAHLDNSHAYFNGTSLFLRPSCEVSSIHVELLPPPSGGQQWCVATSLQMKKVDERGFGLYQSQSYWDLIDHPVEMGDFHLSQFDVNGVGHRIAVTGGVGFESQRLVEDVQKICAKHQAMFADEFPCGDYLFLLTTVEEGYGGLEHKNSTSLLAKRADLPQSAEDPPEKGYRNLLGLFSHEYFHLWNVKRIRPQALKDSDLSREAHTCLLWAFEGITSYYDELALVRAGCISTDSYLELVANAVTRYLRTLGRRVQTVEESGFDAWTKFYKQDENAPNAIVSYYTKGGLIAFGIDVQLRLATDDRVTLDDLMRELWQRYGRPDIGVKQGDIERLAAELAGADLSAFFELCLRSTDDPPLVEWFSAMGVNYSVCPARNAEDFGGAGDGDNSTNAASFGWRLKSAGEAQQLAVVMNGSAAEKAGLAAGDTLVAIDGYRASAAWTTELERRGQPGQQLSVHAFREGVLREYQLELQAAPADTCWLALRDEAELSPVVTARRKAWLED